MGRVREQSTAAPSEQEDPGEHVVTPVQREATSPEKGVVAAASADQPQRRGEALKNHPVPVLPKLQELRDELQYAEHEQGVPELFSMLKSAEVEIQKEHQVLMVNKTTKFKKQGKPKKDLKKGGKKAAAHPEKPKGGPKPDLLCYYCNGKGHWKRNCSKYLADEERPCQEEERYI
ncbi:hypothetical protein QYE76_011777 [Lolium multiflorum]|uniref:CCHC-type domain-containing protein n=1 Tax=Lolium multiflorum TaxID=4521 RepID=A0AAD8TW02_LOLMU|nr:hypothetical protein QYE76_011777 [Lolium multiflorum]